MPFCSIARAQRRLIDYFGARSVDEIRAGTHGGEEERIDQSAGLRIQRDVQADDIGGGSNRHGGVHALHAELTRGVAGQAAAPRHDGQAEGFGAQGDFTADLSEAD